MDTKLTFVAGSETFFEGCNRYPQGAWGQYGLLRHPDGVGYGKLIWEPLEDFDPACGDDSEACDWNHPIEFKLHEGVGYDLDDEEVEISSTTVRSWWAQAVTEGVAELTPIWSSIWLCRDDENNPFESPFYIHDNSGNGCSVMDYDDFLFTVKELDRYLEPIQTNNNE